MHRNPTPILFSLLLKTNVPFPPSFPLLSFPFPSLPLLTTILSSFAHSPFPFLSLRILSLIHRLSFPLSSYSLCSSLSAASVISHGLQIHAAAVKTCHVSNVYTLGALVCFYSRSLTSLVSARQVFDESPERNTVCVNSLLAAYSSYSLPDQAFSLFRSMPALGLVADELTLSFLLRNCGDIANADFGKQVHAYLLCSSLGVEKDAILASCLVEMYGKCGLYCEARSAFEVAGAGGRRDVVMWTSLVNAYGRNGRLDDAINAFEEMLVEKTEPDAVVFLAVISACGRVGKVEKGLDFLELMGRKYGLVPGQEHYGCVIDMLCRAGELERAWKFANANGRKIGVTSWGAILSASRDSGHVEIGMDAARKALELDPGNAGIFVELSNLYAKVGMWDEIEELREEMKKRSLKKDVGCSRLERAAEAT